MSGSDNLRPAIELLRDRGTAGSARRIGLDAGSIEFYDFGNQVYGAVSGVAERNGSHLRPEGIGHVEVLFDD